MSPFTTKQRLLLGAMATVLALSGSICFLRDARAAGAATALDVSVTVNNSCSIIVSPVAFGSYYPSGVNATAPLDAAGSVTVSCTANAGGSRVTLGQGLYRQPGSTAANPLRRMGNGAARLRYNLYSDAAHTTVWDDNTGQKTSKTFPEVMPVYGRIPAAQSVPPGAYADTILATISF